MNTTILSTILAAFLPVLGASIPSASSQTNPPLPTPYSDNALVSQNFPPFQAQALSEEDTSEDSDTSVIDLDSDSDSVQVPVRQEVWQAFHATLIFLGLLLTLLLILPTATAISAWLMLKKLTEQAARAEQEIDSLSTDVLSQLDVRLQEAKTVLAELSELAKVQPQKITEVTAASDTAAQSPHQDLTKANGHPAATSPSAEVAPSPQLAHDYARQAEKAFMNGDLETAIQSYDQSLKLDPGVAEIWNNRGVVLMRLQRYHEAIVSYEQAIHRRSNYPDAWNNRGVVLSKLQHYEAAVVSYDQAIQLRSDYLDAWNNRGFALTRLQRYEDALTSYQKAIQLDPKLYLLWYNQARCYTLKGQADAAIESLTTAIQLNPQMSRGLAVKENDFETLEADPRFQHLIYGVNTSGTDTSVQASASENSPELASNGKVNQETTHQEDSN
ncbi:MAG: tetratricopeptide repeat protein [Microcoleaceae cyanobacterium]